MKFIPHTKRANIFKDLGLENFVREGIGAK
jgi:hypothetical protein